MKNIIDHLKKQYTGLFKVLYTVVIGAWFNSTEADDHQSFIQDICSKIVSLFRKQNSWNYLK